MDGENVTVWCENHHEILTNGLWELFNTKRGVDFYFQWGQQSVRAHRLVVDAFLSTDTLQFPNSSPAPAASSSDHDIFESIFQFMYQGRMTVDKNQLDNCHLLAEQLQFKMLVDAFESSTWSDDRTFVTITSQREEHHETLTRELWNSFTNKRGINFYSGYLACPSIQGDKGGITFPVLAHQIVVEVFFGTENLISKLNKEQASSAPGGRHVERSILDSLVEFMYKGRVVVPKDDLNCLLQIATELDFGILVEAVNAVRLELYETSTKRTSPGIELGSVNLAKSPSPPLTLASPELTRTVKKIRMDSTTKAICEQSSFDVLSTDDVATLSDNLSISLQPEVTSAEVIALESDNTPRVTEATSNDDESNDGSDELGRRRNKTGSNKSKLNRVSKFKRMVSITPFDKCDCIIEQLLAQPFANLDFQTQCKIVCSGRPTPSMPNLVQDDRRGVVRRFRERSYERIDWLCGCAKLNRLFCWPCLLFPASLAVWDRTGYADLNNFHTAVGRHARSQIHAVCLKRLSEIGAAVISPGNVLSYDGYSDDAPEMESPSGIANDVAELQACEQIVDVDVPRKAAGVATLKNTSFSKKTGQKESGMAALKSGNEHQRTEETSSDDDSSTSDESVCSVQGRKKTTKEKNSKPKPVSKFKRSVSTANFDNSMTTTTSLDDVQCGCILEQLLTLAFAKRDFLTQTAILRTGRPTPSLPGLVQPDDRRGFVRRFRERSYEKIDWLSGCVKLNRLFCWPCVLFSGSYSVWDRTGYADLNNFHNAAVRHSRSQCHGDCVQSLIAFTADAMMMSEDGDGSAVHDSSVERSSMSRTTWENRSSAGQVPIDIVSTLIDSSGSTNTTRCDLPNGCVIEQLLAEPFEGRDSDSRAKIVSVGRPTPQLPGLTKESKAFVRRFQDTVYEKSDWLAGCHKLSRLFCWPCLLFSKNSSVWNQQGYCDLNNLHNAVQRHGQSQKHAVCALALSTYGKTGDEDPDIIS